MNLDKHQRSKQRGQDFVGRSTTVHIFGHLLFCTHTLSRITVTRFLLVSSMNKPNCLFYFASICAQSTLKIKDKNIKELCWVS